MNFPLKIVFVMIVCVFGTSCVNEQVKSQNNPPKVVEISKETRISEANKSVFCLSVYVANRKIPARRAIGTAFLVSENLVATAFHVKKDLDTQMFRYGGMKPNILAWKKFDNGDVIEIPLKFVSSDTKADIALYSLDAETLRNQAKNREIKPLALAERLPNLGEDIFSIGYYDEMEFPFNSLGNVSMIDKGEDIYADMTIMPGNSGSPLISAKTGEVLGINVKVMTIGDSTLRLGIARRIADLKLLIEKSKN